MIEATGNLWTYPADFRVITTNGFVRTDGEAVMGRGCAAEAKQKYPSLPAMLGARIRRLGNRVHFFETIPIFTFPVKHAWNQPASLTLIEQSIAQFKSHVLTSCTYVMPRPGCGNGQLRWETVKPLCIGLPDNVVIITFPPR